MNIKTEQLLNRSSIHNLARESIVEQDLIAILQVAQHAPTSINGQNISLLVTRDKAKIAAIADIADGQLQVASTEVFITVVVDFHRPATALKSVGVEQVIQQSAKAVVVGAVDAGIMLNVIQVAAEALGYGTTTVGDIRNDPQALIELLNLPANTLPLVGTTIEVVDITKQAPIKPRVALDSFAMFEKYDTEKVADGVSDYYVKLRQWWCEQGETDQPDYANHTVQYYSQVYFPYRS